MKTARGIVVQFEPPETLVVAYSDAVDGKTVRMMRQEMQPLLASLPHHLLLVDLRNLTSMSADARLATVERPPPGTSPLRGVAVVGASFHMKTLGTMMARAAEVLYGHVNSPIRFFDSVDESRIWLAERRKELANS